MVQYPRMWNWSTIKSIILGIVISTVLVFAGFSIKAVIILTLGFSLFAHWIIEEINFIRNAHGTNIAKLENKIEELETEIKKLKNPSK